MNRSLKYFKTDCVTRSLAIFAAAMIIGFLVLSWLSSPIQAVEGGQQKAEPEMILPVQTLIYQHQRKLKDAGFYDGPIDGLAGPLTLKAYDEYEHWYIYRGTK